jgi:hypothetical protein
MPPHSGQDFPLNPKQEHEAKILLASSGFGCGRLAGKLSTLAAKSEATAGLWFVCHQDTIHLVGEHHAGLSV